MQMCEFPPRIVQPDQFVHEYIGIVIRHLTEKEDSDTNACKQKT